MPTKPRRRCTSCKKLHDRAGGRCETCHRAAVNARSAARPSPAERGYTGKHRSVFRPGVLYNDPWCVCEETWCPHDGPCGEKATRADHYPHGRDELIEMGEDPDDPKWGRGLCASCDGRQTARRQPGGWNQATGTRA